jgi:hypothetical protein
MNHLEELADLIKAGSVKNITSFGGNKLGLPAPYVVIVPLPAAPDKQAFQIWAHFSISQNNEIEAYVKGELPRLIFSKKNLFGQPKYKSNATYDGVSVDGGDNTLKAGKVFYIPLILR